MAIDRGLQRVGQPLGLATHNLHQHGPERLPCPSHELGEIRTTLHQASHKRKHVTHPTLSDKIQQLRIRLVVDEAESVSHPSGGDRAGPESERLIEEGERVTHPAIRHTRDEQQGIVVHFDGLLTCDILQSCPDGAGADAAKVKALQPAQHRCCRARNLLGFRCCEHKDDVAWRLFENLE